MRILNATVEMITGPVGPAGPGGPAGTGSPAALELTSSPIDAEAAMPVKSNNTVTIGTSTSVSVPGFSYAAFSNNYVYQGGGLWATTSNLNRTLRHNGTRWVAKFYDFINGTYPELWAAGSADADPSTLPFAHAAGSSASGGTWTVGAVSGAFAGTAGTVAIAIGQPAVVIGAAIHFCLRLSPVKWSGPLT